MCYEWCTVNCISLFLLKGTCQSCGVGGPNLWACLQVRSLFPSKHVTQVECIFRIIIIIITLFVLLSPQCGCPYVGCGESHSDHSTIHAQVTFLFIQLFNPFSGIRFVQLLSISGSLVLLYVYASFFFFSRPKNTIWQ